MKKFKEFISLLIALHLFSLTLFPAYAKNAEINESVIFNNTHIASLDETDNEDIIKNSNQIIIKFKDDSSQRILKKSKNRRIKSKVKGEKEFEIKNKHYSVVTVSEDENIDNFIQSIDDEYSEEIEMIQPDYLIGSFSNEIEEVMNVADTVKNINIADNVDTAENVDAIEETVKITDTDDDIIVAVIDTAIDYDHEALVDSIYVNSLETKDGIDNDDNGYVDDIIGWDFIKGADISQSDLNSNHGTHVAGLIVAEGIGVGTNAKILPLNVFNDGLAYTSDIIAAIEYAENAGAKIVNCSWGSTINNPALEEAISNSDMLFVCAAGNSGMNIDETPVYPASYNLDNIISVGASNDRDYLAYFSNYGENVDIAANGYKVQSSFVNDNYGIMMGTSMSTAYVSGVAALVYNGSAIETKNVILGTSDKINTLEDVINNSRRINCDNAVSGSVNSAIIKNTNIDYDKENYNNKMAESDGYELFDLDPEPEQISAGLQHSLVVDNWGLVKSYGDNTYNQLGNRDESDIYLYNGTVVGLDYVEKVSTFANHNLALIDGTVYAWGQNDRYQLGHTNGDVNAIPTQVEFFNADGSVPNIVDISAGGWFSLALDSDGNVWAWGDNKYGQFANGETGYCSAIPRIIMSGVSKISAGKYHALAIKDGVVYGWGRSAGEYTLGKNAVYSQSTPIEIAGLTDTVTDIEAGDRCSFFITADGVYVLGANENGQLGNGTTTNISIPTLLDISAVEKIESNGTTLFLTSNGDVYACGQNTYGQLGQGHTNTRYTEPTKIPGNDYDKIASGGYHNLLFKCNEEYPEDQWYYRNATVYAIGRNDSGQCIQTAGANIIYPTSVIEIENTEDTGPFAWDSNHIRPMDATYVSQNGWNYAENYYGENTINVRYTNKESGADGWGEYSYLKFDIRNIPKERITSAKLHLYVENEGDMRESVRTIGVYDTYENNWDGQLMTWKEGRVGSRTLIDTFTVTATGYMIEDVGWHEIDITDYLKNNCIDDELSLMLKMISTQAYQTVITSGVYNDAFTLQDMMTNKNIPVLEIEYDSEDSSVSNRKEFNASADTYISQHSTEYSTNFSNSEYLCVNYTPNEIGNGSWGQDSYLTFNLDGINELERANIGSAKLWLYVDPKSDVRKSLRKITVSGNNGLKYSADTISWSRGRFFGKYELGGFTVEGNGYEVLTSGWKQIDVTDFVKSTDSQEVEFILKMVSETQHPIKIHSSEYSDESTRPRLIIDMQPIDISQNYFTNVPLNERLMYKFIPTATNEYIFTSVGGNGLTAVLFDENMEQLSVSENAGGEFRVRYSFETGKKYYLKVSSKENLEGNYKLYLEKPFELLRIE